MPEGRGRVVGGDEVGRDVEDGVERPRRVASDGGVDVRERGADVQDERGGERREAARAEGGEDAEPEGGARGVARDLLAVDEALRHLLHDRRRRRDERLGVGLEELRDAVERVLAHALAVVRALAEELGEAQAALRHRGALALRVHRPEAAGRGAVAGLRGLLEPSCGERPVLLDAAA